MKSILLGSIATGLTINGCKPDTDGSALNEEVESKAFSYGRTEKETKYDEEILSSQFLNEHELSTIKVLANQILPKGEGLGTTDDANVPEFIEFMAKDIEKLQPILRGGLMWLDHECNTLFEKEFIAATTEERKQILDKIAYPDIDIPEDERPQEVQFFSLVRNLTVTGYYTSKIGIEELGYKGNSPNVWDGVPQDVLDQHKIAYEQEWLDKCIDQSTRGTLAEWDDDGNLLT